MPAGYQLFTQQAPSPSSPTPACWTATLLTLETQVFIQDQQCMSQESKELGSEDTQRRDGRTLPHTTASSDSPPVLGPKC